MAALYKSSDQNSRSVSPNHYRPLNDLTSISEAISLAFSSSKCKITSLDNFLSSIALFQVNNNADDDIVFQGLVRSLLSIMNTQSFFRPSFHSAFLYLDSYIDIFLRHQLAKLPDIDSIRLMKRLITNDITLKFIDDRFDSICITSASRFFKITHEFISLLNSYYEISHNRFILFIMYNNHFDQLTSMIDDDDSCSMLFSICDNLDIEDNVKISILCSVFNKTSFLQKKEIIKTLTRIISSDLLVENINDICTLFNSFGTEYKDSCSKKDEDDTCYDLDNFLFLLYKHFKEIARNKSDFIHSVRECYFVGRECNAFDMNNSKLYYFDYFLYYNYSHEEFNIPPNEIVSAHTDFLREHGM